MVATPTTVPIGAVLISINPDPPLSLTPGVPQTTQSATNLTPVSTPQGVSPSDPSAGAAATPSEVATDAANDPDAHLVDTTDETWAVVMSHRLNNSNSLTDWRPALASGFLIKRGGDGTSAGASTSTSNIEEATIPGPITVGVNVVWIGSSRVASQNQNSSQNSAQTPVSTPSVTMPGTPFPPGGVPTMTQNQPQAAPAAASAAAAIGGMRGGPSIDPLLREYLHYYRGLGLLARVRGMRGTKGGAVPWHIVAAVNAVRGLERCM